MKSSTQLIITCLFALGIFLSSFSVQSQTYVIGAFTGQNASNAYPTPYGDQFESTRAQYLYFAADLIAAGVPAGNITSIGFTVVDLNFAEVSENYTIKLALTNQTALTTTWVLNTTTVYGPINYQPALGLNVHNLGNGFYWDGSSNLLVEVCHSPTVLMGSSSSFNASVELTTAFPENVSLTYRVFDDLNVCNTTSFSNTDEMSRPRLFLTVCQPPQNLIVQTITSTSAQLSWSPPVSGSPQIYQWVYGNSTFVPGGAGEIGNGITTNMITNTTITGLSGNTQYKFYVRAKCEEGFSAWTGPATFVTELSCNNDFTDTNAGLLGNYATGENYVRVFCPDEADKALKMSFVTFSTGLGDTLRIYNGNSTTAPLFGAFSGVYLPLTVPGPFTATTASGCLTVKFKSDTTASPLDLGWQAQLSCAALPIDSCYRVLQLKLNSLDFNTAQVSWAPMFGAPNYSYKLFQAPAIVVKPTTTTANNVVNLDSLIAGTNYIFVVRSNCNNGANSVWDTLRFNTPVRCQTLPSGASNLIGCDDNITVVTSGIGLWNVTKCGGTTPGKERIFRFKAPNTQNYKFILTAPANSNDYINYFYKPVSAGCGQADWNCLGSVNNSPDTLSFGPLTAGVEYFILADPTLTGLMSQTFKISGCTPVNDLPINAVLLDLTASCEQNIYSNRFGSIDAGEPDPSTIGRWTEAAENTVWFKFIAPPSGTVTISTNNSGAVNPNGDTQIALYKVGVATDYGSFVLLESDEDDGATFNSNFTYTGLSAGLTYYLQVDSWAINAGSTPFCIQVANDAVRQTGDDCTEYKAYPFKGSNWVNIYTSPVASDIGKLVLAVNPLGTAYDTIYASIKTFPTIPLSGNNVPYMPAYFRLRSAPAITGNIAVRLFFYNTELEALKTAANLPGNNASQLVISQYNGANTDCNQLNNSGPSTLITNLNATIMANSFYLEFNTSVLGEFGAHFGLIPLPLELQSFTGKIVGRSNLLEWATLIEKNVQWHIVERSVEGASWTEVGRAAGQVDSKTLKSYSLVDAQPLTVAYYRLRSVDTDGTESVSKTVRLVRPDRAFGIAEVLPNPATDRLTVRFNSPQEESVTLRLFDFTGRLVLEQSADSEVGMNAVILPVSALPGGIYQLLLTDGSEVSTPVRVVKQ